MTTRRSHFSSCDHRWKISVGGRHENSDRLGLVRRQIVDLDAAVAISCVWSCQFLFHSASETARFA